MTLPIILLIVVGVAAVIALLYALSKKGAQPSTPARGKARVVPYAVREEVRHAAATPVQEPPKPEPAPVPTSPLQPVLIEDEEEEESAEMPAELATFKLKTTAELSEEKRKELELLSKKSPRPPSLLYEIFQHLTLGSYDAKEFSRLAGSDPVLGGKLIQTVNSPFFGLRSEVNSVQRVVVYLGFNYVKDIALRQAMEVAFKADKSTLHSAYRKFWTSSFIASAICFRLAKHFDRVDSAALATRALMAYLGNFAILANLPEWGDMYMEKTGLFRRTQAEQDYLGFNSATVGAFVAGLWSLPSTVTESIENSISPLAVPPDDCADKDIAGLVVSYFSCRVADEISFNDIRDVGSVKIDFDNSPEFYWLKKYLRRLRAEQLPGYLNDPTLRNEVNKIILHMHSEKPSGS